ncbi:hypothetical protein KGQ72_00925 [Patescibacteria group bacterium]|nr:hypothetical protein [Patescibacteria group bacterium]
MRSNRTDLLPPERRAALARDYLLRLSVVSVLFVTALLLVAMLLLVPTYVLLVGSQSAKEAHIATIESTLSSSNGTTLSARLTALSDNAATLSALAHLPSASAIIRSVLAIARPGVTLSGLAYTPPAGKNSGALALSGVAATRDALRSYQLALQGTPSILSADLPVSAYAKDSNIAFTITVTLAP